MSMEAPKTLNFPPFYGKNDWIIDPEKIVTREAHITLKISPEERKEEAIKVGQKPVKKQVRFASYVDVHMICPVINDHIRYPSKMIEELKQENALLSDELLISEKRNEQLEAKLRRTKQELSHARTINDMMPLWMLVLMMVGSVLLYKYAQLNL